MSGDSAPELRTRLAQLGMELPPVATPLAAYVPARRVGNLVMTAGQLPLVAGQLTSVGLVAEAPSQPADDPADFVTVEEAYVAARACALNALAAAVSVLDDPDSIVGVVQVVGYVASAPGFTGQPAVLNGASELFLEIFGDAGRHARSAVGVAALPLGAPVEIELTVEVQG